MVLPMAVVVCLRRKHGLARLCGTRETGLDLFVFADEHVGIEGANAPGVDTKQGADRKLFGRENWSSDHLRHGRTRIGSVGVVGCHRRLS